MSEYYMDADDELQAQQLMVAHNYLDFPQPYHRCPIDQPPCPECQERYDEEDGPCQ